MVTYTVHGLHKDLFIYLFLGDMPGQVVKDQSQGPNRGNIGA